MKATLSFPSRETARAFARAWACFSLRGYTLGAKQEDGSATLTLDNLKPAEIAWLDAQTAKINAATHP